MPALSVGACAPNFSFADGTRQYSLDEFRGAPVILAFAPPGGAARQPVLQHLTFEGERLAVLAPHDDALALEYGIRNQFAVFVIGSNGQIAWRQTPEDSGADAFPGSATSGLSRREFLAAMFAASMA